MNRTLSAVAAACTLLCLAAGAQAQSASPAPTSNTKIYGLIDMSAGRFQAPGGPRTSRVESGSMTTSYLGFNGTEDLGGGLQARFALEAFNRTDIGASGRFNGDAFYARNAFVGLSGAFGTTQLGRNTTPLFVSTLIFNAFGDSFGFSPSIRQYFTAPALPVGSQTSLVGDSGWNNSLLYTNRYGNVSVTLLGNAGEGAATAVGRNISANLVYLSGPIGFTIVGQQVKNATGSAAGRLPAPEHLPGRRQLRLQGRQGVRAVRRDPNRLDHRGGRREVEDLGPGPVGAGRRRPHPRPDRLFEDQRPGRLRLAAHGERRLRLQPVEEHRRLRRLHERARVVRLADGQHRRGRHQAAFLSEDRGWPRDACRPRCRGFGPDVQQVGRGKPPTEL